MADPKKARRGSKTTITMAAHHREKIRASRLLERLEANGLGELDEEMTKGQIQSALGVLRKVLPDLTSQALTGADGEGPAVVVLMKDGKGK